MLTFEEYVQARIDLDNAVLGDEFLQIVCKRLGSAYSLDGCVEDNETLGSAARHYERLSRKRADLFS